MKIGYFADGPWAHKAFEMLEQDPRVDIQFVCGRHDTFDSVLCDLAKRNDIPWLQHPDINADEFHDMICGYDCDLFVSMSFNQIFRERTFNLPPRRTINCHASKLPFYRGRNILNWVLINDEKEFGITVHYIAEGVDTGDIICQRTYPITDADDYGTLLKRAHLHCAEVLAEAISLIIDDAVEPIDQTTLHPVGSYCTQRGWGDEEIDWTSSSRDVFNFVRAICRPGPMARTWRGDDEVSINRVELIDGAPNYRCVCGAVLCTDSVGVLVKTGDSFVRMTDYEVPGQRLRVGDRLGQRVAADGGRSPGGAKGLDESKG
jgi:methionyl-tRNA formyltransferase